MSNDSKKVGTRFSLKGALAVVMKAPPGGKGIFLHLADGV